MVVTKSIFGTEIVLSVYSIFSTFLRRVAILTCFPWETRFWPFFPFNILKSLSHFSISSRANNINTFTLSFPYINECQCLLIFMNSMVSIFTGHHIFKTSPQDAPQKQVFCNAAILDLKSKSLKNCFESLL